MLAGVERQDGTHSRVAVDAVFDSVSVATTFQEELAKAGVLFMPNNHYRLLPPIGGSRSAL